MRMILNIFPVGYRYTVDTKCGATAVCWYCQDLCERCLKPATHTFNTAYENNTYNFCSVDCKDSCFVNQENFSTKLDDCYSDNTIQLKGYILKHDKFPSFVHINISANNNALLISYYERSLQSQLYCQVLCNSTFEVLNPVLNDGQLASEDDLKKKQINMLHSMVENLKTSSVLKITAGNITDVVQKLGIQKMT